MPEDTGQRPDGPKGPDPTVQAPEQIDPGAHRRLLRYLNQARTPDDLVIAPHDRRIVDEEMDNGDNPQPPEEKKILTREIAKEII